MALPAVACAPRVGDQGRRGAGVTAGALPGLTSACSPALGIYVTITPSRRDSHETLDSFDTLRTLRRPAKKNPTCNAGCRTTRGRARMTVEALPTHLPVLFFVPPETQNGLRSDPSCESRGLDMSDQIRVRSSPTFAAWDRAFVSPIAKPHPLTDPHRNNRRTQEKSVGAQGMRPGAEASLGSYARLNIISGRARRRQPRGIRSFHRRGRRGDSAIG